MHLISFHHWGYSPIQKLSSQSNRLLITILQHILNSLFELKYSICMKFLNDQFSSRNRRILYDKDLLTFYYYERKFDI